MPVAVLRAIPDLGSVLERAVALVDNGRVGAAQRKKEPYDQDLHLTAPFWGPHESIPQGGISLPLTNRERRCRCEVRLGVPRVPPVCVPAPPGAFEVYLHVPRLTCRVPKCIHMYKYPNSCGIRQKNEVRSRGLIRDGRGLAATSWRPCQHGRISGALR